MILLVVKGFQGLNSAVYMEACVMSDVQKAARAINHVLNLLRNDQEQQAVKLMEMAYQCSSEEAMDFVYSVKDALK